MRKKKRVKRPVPMDEQLRVEAVNGRATPPPSPEAVVKANEPYFSWLAQQRGPAEADRARSELIARLERAAEHAKGSHGATNIVRVTRST